MKSKEESVNIFSIPVSNKTICLKAHTNNSVMQLSLPHLDSTVLGGPLKREREKKKLPNFLNLLKRQWKTE